MLRLTSVVTRTVKSFGPGAVVLALSPRRRKRPAGDGGKEPFSGRDRSKP